MFSRIAALLLVAAPVAAHATPACIEMESTWVWADCDAGYFGEGCECDCNVEDDFGYYSYIPGDLCETWGTLAETISTDDTATTTEPVDTDTSDTATPPAHECVFLRSDCTEWSGGGGSWDSGIDVDDVDDDDDDDDEEHDPIIQFNCATGPAPLNPAIVLLFATGLTLRRSRA